MAKSNNNRKRITKSGDLWTIETIHGARGETVEWLCDVDFTVRFPQKKNPLVEGHELSSNGSGKVTATVKKNAQVTPPGRGQRYFIFITKEGEEDVVLGKKSPPEMIVE